MGIFKKSNPNTEAYWNSKYDEMVRSGELRSDGKHLDKFLPIFQNSASILDFGCGLGGNVRYLSSLLSGKRFCLIDQSEVCLRYVSENLLGRNDDRGNRFEYHTGYSKLPVDSVDTVMSIEVLEHITDYMQVMTDLWNLVSPKGYLLISVPVKGWRDRHREHVNKFTVSEMFRILSGFSEIVHISVRSYSKRSGRLATAYFYIQKQE